MDFFVFEQSKKLKSRVITLFYFRLSEIKKGNLVKNEDLEPIYLKSELLISRNSQDKRISLYYKGCLIKVQDNKFPSPKMENSCMRGRKQGTLDRKKFE